MKTKPVERFHAKDYLGRAEELKAIMDVAFENRKWNACVINAIHCAISSADAYCIYKKGLKSASDNHLDATSLFASIDQNDPDIARNVMHLSSLLGIKSGAEYGDRLLNEKDAVQAKKHAERLFDFVKEKIK